MLSVGTFDPPSTPLASASVHVPTQSTIAPATHGAQVGGLVCATSSYGDDVVRCPCRLGAATDTWEVDDCFAVASVFGVLVGARVRHQ